MAASRLITGFAFFVALASPALATTCVIVVPNDQVGRNASPQIVYDHETARCKGWTHKAIAPQRYKKMPWPAGLKLEVNRVPTDVAERLCRAMGGNSYGCQWFE